MMVLDDRENVWAHYTSATDPQTDTGRQLVPRLPIVSRGNGDESRNKWRYSKLYKYVLAVIAFRFHFSVEMSVNRVTLELKSMRAFVKKSTIAIRFIKFHHR